MSRTERREIDHSTVAKDDYTLFLEFFSYTGALVVYFANLKLAGCISTKQGFWTALVFVSVMAVFTYFLTRKNRSRLQGFLSVLIGMTGYTFFIYWRTRFSMCAIFTRISLMIVVASFFLYLIIGTRKRKLCIVYFFSRLTDSFYLSRILVAGVGIVACILIPISYHIQVNQIYKAGTVSDQTKETVTNTFANDYRADGQSTRTVFQEEDYQINEIYGDEYRLGLNIERIKLVVSEEWESLTLEQRQDTTTAIAECQARYFGIPFRLTVKFSDDMPYEIKGYYSHSEHLICINNEALIKDGGIAALVTTLHEMRHCFQHCMCDAFIKLSPEQRNLYCFYGVDKWCENINNYIDGEENYYEYRDQTLEEDARSSAYKESKVYVNEIISYLNEIESSDTDLEETTVE